MLEESSYDRVVALIRLKENVAVFLYIDGDTLCTRSRSVLSSLVPRMQALGYAVLALKVSEFSSHYEEVSCVRAPQLRLFRSGRLKSKLVGILTRDNIYASLRDSVPK